jgi:MFS family permease
MCLGAIHLSFGVLYVPLEAEFGWSRAAISFGYSTLLVGFSVSAVVSGKMSDKTSPRLILLVGAVLIGISLVSAANATASWHFWALLFVTGLGTGTTSPTPTSVVQKWFFGRSRSGMALAMVMSAVGVGGLLFSPLLSSAIATWGLKTSLTLAGATFFVLITVSAVAITPAPSELAPAAGVSSISRPCDESGTSIFSGPVRRLFLSITVANVIALFAFQTVNTQFVRYAADLGASQTFAGVALGMMAGSSVPGRLVAGLLGDTLGWRKTMMLSLLGMAGAVVALLVTPTPRSVLAAAIVFGFFHGLRTVAVIGMMGWAFGTRQLGELVGWTVGIAQVSGAPAPLVAGFVFDRTGSYGLVFVSVAMLCLFGAAILMRLRARQSS